MEVEKRSKLLAVLSAELSAEDLEMQEILKIFDLIENHNLALRKKVIAEIEWILKS